MFSYPNIINMSYIFCSTVSHRYFLLKLFFKTLFITFSCTQEPLGRLHPTSLWVPPSWLMGTSRTQCALPLPTTPLCNRLPMCTPKGGSKGKLRKTENEHMQKVGLNFQSRERLQAWAVVSLLGKAKRGCQHWTWCIVVLKAALIQV